MDATLERIHLAGGLRADALAVSVDDRLSASSPHRDALGVALGPRATLSVDATSWLAPSISYGQGFRSLDARHLRDGETHPYSTVSSAELGMKARALHGRYAASIAFYETRVGNELVFDAASGGLETQGASVRRGMTASVLSRPIEGMVVSAAFSVNRAKYEAATADGNHYVPSVPTFLFRSDASARRSLFALDGHDVYGRVATGFTLLGPRHLNDRVMGAPHTIINAAASTRYRAVELGVDIYNALDLRYPDDEAVYVSNWGTTPGQPPASLARHVVAAPPRTVLGTLTLTM